MNNNFNPNQQPQQPQQPNYQQPQQPNAFQQGFQNAQQGFQQMFQQPQAPKGGFNTKALLGLILGGIGFFGFCLSWTIPFFGILAFFASIVGLVFGIMGMGHAKAAGTGKGLAIAGLIVAIVGIFFGFIGLICNSCFSCVYCEVLSYGGDLEDVYYYMF